MLKILSYTTLFPNSQQKTHGIFVENRLRHLHQSGEVDLTIMAPVPWFPFTGKCFGHYGAYPLIPAIEETNFGVKVLHPRYITLPKVGMTIAPTLLYKATLPAVEAYIKEHGKPDLIDAHYFYPDGVAAAKIGRKLGIPVVITARGSDISQIADYTLPRFQIKKAAKSAAGIITVCEALRRAIIDLKIPAKKIHTLRNGVDLDMFAPKSMEEARNRYHLPHHAPVLLSVGHLVERKGHHLIIKAMKSLPIETHLVIAGDGPLKEELQDLIIEQKMEHRIHLLGNIGHHVLPWLYSAANYTVLASSREGWANVLLESMACGTPCVATSIWGTPEVIAAPEAGLLISERLVKSIADTLNHALTLLPTDRTETRHYAERFSWDETTQGQLELFKTIISKV